MKLIRLYIENFGCLCEFELDFEEGLTAINRPNGFGKTTLAEFIRAMFYGFPRKAKTLEKSKRQKYTPWDGGTFGGNLVFEHEGKRYRMERTFGSTPKADTFTLIDLETNRKSNRFSDEIGVELFGLDSDSFERSVYLPQAQEGEPLTTAAIQAKLTNLVEDSSDVGSYDKALVLLRAKRSALIPYRGSGGAVAETAVQITKLQLQLDRAQAQYERLKALQITAAQTAQELENTKHALAQLQLRLAAASENAAKMVYRDRYEQLCRENGKISAQIRALQDDYPAGFPTLSELTEAEEKADKLAVLETQTMSLDTQQRLPTEEELAACRKKCEEFAALQQDLRIAESALSQQVQKEREYLAELPEKSVRAATAAWLITALAACAGVAFFVVKQRLYGIIALGIAAAAMIAACVLTLHRKKQQREKRLQKKRESDDRIAAVQQQILQLRQRCDQYCKEIARFFAEMGINTAQPHFQAALAKLEYRVQLSAQNRQNHAVIAQLRMELDAFFARYNQNPDDHLRLYLRSMRDALHNIHALTARQQELRESLTQIEQKYPDLSSLLQVKAEDIRPLRQEEQHMRNAVASLTEALMQQKQELQHLQMQTEEIPELREELARLQDQMETDRENARILDETMDFLQQARERLSTGYMGTIRAYFNRYMAQLEAASEEKYLIDTDFQVYPERMGKVRELAYFSEGQADLVMLCMRLALVDALFKSEDMFVILDDPFVNLDDTHTAQARKLLHTLAAKRQIIYLTCHSSRNM